MEENGLMTDTVRTDRLRMDYCRFGQGKDTLVILPGLSVQSVVASAQAVARAYQELTADFTVYLFDRRKNPPPAYSVKQMAEDTAEAMRALGLGSACFFGASQGGMIAMEIALSYPDMVRKLILGSTAARVSAEGYRVIDQWIRLAREGDAESLYQAFGRAVYPEAVYAGMRGLLSEMSKSVTREELDRFAVIAAGTLDFDLSDRVAGIRCPVLVLGSRDDGVLGTDGMLDIAERLKNRPDFQMHLYEHYGHAAYDLAPDYRARMRAFLTAPEMNEQQKPIRASK